MPSRRHTKSSAPTPKPTGAPAAPATGRDPAEMFAAALKESEARDKAKREKDRQQQEATAKRKAEEQAHADALTSARRDLDRAIQAVRDAKRNGRSTVEADAAWKAAKAKVIELETGAAPSWAPLAPADRDSVSDASSDDDATGDESPGDGDAVAEESA